MQRSTRATGLRPATGRLVLALALVGVVGGIAAVPARADDDRGRREHLDRERAARDEWRDHRRRRVYVAPPPAYVYAPPPVVYAPPPPPSGINLIFPLNIR